MSHHSGPLVKRLRHRPFTAVSRVRFPDGSPHGRLAQLGERLPYKQDVGSSILSSSTTCGNSSAVEHRLAKAGVASSNLVSRSIHSSIAQLVEQSAVNRSVVGSSPTSSAMWLVGETVNSHAFHACIHGFESRTSHHLSITSLRWCFFYFFIKYVYIDICKFCISLNYRRRNIRCECFYFFIIICIIAFIAK